MAHATEGGRGLAVWRDLSPAAHGLMEIRALRSLAQGLFVVDFTLYLHAAGWGAAAIGALLTAEGLVGAALMLLVGVLSDRYGRRAFLLAYQGLVFVGMAAVLAWPMPWTVAAVAVALGLGRGANGAAGPFGPAEQAWLARTVPHHLRARAFSLNNGATYVGMGIGSALAGTVVLFRHFLPGAHMYLPMFALAGVIAVVNAIQLLTLPEVRTADAGPAAERGGAAPAAEAPGLPSPDLRRAQNGALMRLMGVNAVNALAIGMVGPLIPYWFNARFGIGPDVIGSIYALSFVLTAAASVFTGDLATRFGTVPAVVLTRTVGVALMAALPILPTYPLAAGAYAVRSMANRGSAGARNALGVSIMGDERRGLAASLNGLSMRLPSSLGPALGGWMFSMGNLELPFFLAAALQCAFLVLFGVALRDVEALGARTDRVRNAEAT